MRACAWLIQLVSFKMLIMGKAGTQTSHHGLGQVPKRLPSEIFIDINGVVVVVVV